MTLSHGSLFSGIGGLDLGLVWAGLPAPLWQVESDPWCRSVLARHFPAADRSVTDVRLASSRNLASVDLIAGGFPCQDVSSAGAGAGLEGARSGLWFEFQRIVAELRPRFVLVENVASGAKRWVCPVRSGLHELGYRTRAFALSAADIGAPHRRNRIFILARLADTGGDELREQPRGGSRPNRPRSPEPGDAREADLADAHGDGREGERSGGLLDVLGSARGHDAHRRDDEGAASNERTPPPERNLGRDPDGLSARVDRFPAGRGEAQFAWEPPRTSTEKGGNRRARLRALGNACVPHCALAFGRLILEEESER